MLIKFISPFNMEEVKKRFRHFLLSEIIILLLFTFYFFLNIIHKSISGGIESLFIMYIVIIDIIIISSVNLVISVVFYFINKILPKIVSILLIFLVFIFTITFYYYEPLNKNVNVSYKDIPESNYDFYKILILIILILIIINMLIKFIPYLKREK